MRKKITVVGAGRVGETTAHILAERALGDIVLVDIVPKMAEGKALDLMELRPISGSDVSIVGTTDYEATKGSDLVVVTSGMPRKPGESREDLLKKNIAIVKSVVGEVKKTSPDALLMVVANPLDTMTWVAREVTGWPRNRVFGMAGVLDTSRLRTFIAMELGCSVKDVNAFVLGGHGDEMVPVVRYASVGAIPIEQLIPKEKIDAIVKRTRGAGGEIVKLLGFSAYFSPAGAVADMVQSVVRDEKRVLPCSARLEGEYGAKDIYLGVPVMLGANGMEKIFEVELSAEEKEMLAASVKLCTGSIDIARKLMNE
ncbi:MAG: malate dehydrogenase [Acidobacteria bacterium]|jgi:malate dehydrogenase|nr:malate dehydrogenase [Acidobacteriota bacterium]